MKIKIVEPGYEGYTGYFGAVEFVNAESVAHVSSAEAALLAAILRIETVEGEAVGDLADHEAMQNVGAVSHRLPTTAELMAARESGVKVIAEVMGEPAAQQSAESRSYTQEELEAVADAEGIVGLRKIADQFGIKGTSITKLIKGVIVAQGGTYDEAGE